MCFYDGIALSDSDKLSIHVSETGRCFEASKQIPARVTTEICCITYCVIDSANTIVRFRCGDGSEARKKPKAKAKP